MIKLRRKTGIVICLAIALVSGCTPDAYQKSADLQVQKLVKDREQQTLGYTPKMDAPVQTQAKLTRKSYEKIPTTPIAPPGPAPISPSGFDLTYGPLGPEQLFPSGTASPRHEPLSVDEARAPALERLRLGPPAFIANVPAFDLFKSIEYAVLHSREYQSRMEDLYLAALDVTLERHLFEPRPFASVAARYTGGQLDGSYRTALTLTNSIGVRQKLPYGGEVVAQGLVEFVNALNDNVDDGESAQLALSGSIPLLRGAGMVNLESLIRSERGMVYEVRRFEDFRRQFVVDIASQYFRLITQQQAIANRRMNYIISAQLTERSYALYAAGQRGFDYLSVQRAQQQQLRAENSLILAYDVYNSSLDDFKIALGMPVDDQLDIVPIELDVTPPDLDAENVAMALKYRLDLQTAQDQIEDARRGVGVAKNGLLPDLDFVARGAVGNRPDTPLREVDSRNLDYSAGLNLDLPLDRVSERNAYRRALISLERAQRTYSTTRDTVIAQVRDAMRSIRSARDSLEIQARSVEIARRQVDFSNEKLALGLDNDSRNAVDAQNQLLSAQDAYEQARANYQIQILQFLRDTGTLRINPQAGALGLAMDRAEAARQN